VNKAKRVHALAGVILLAMVLAAGNALAFFPVGGFNEFGQMRFAVWPIVDFDTDNDGVIEQGEGLPFRLESGPRGFTPEEIKLVKEGFRVWENVPTSFVRFRFQGEFQDSIVPGITTPDYLPTVFMQVSEAGGLYSPTGGSNFLPDPTDAIIPEVDSLLGVALVAYAITDVPIQNGQSTTIVPSGNILDCDIIISAAAHRDAGLTSLGAFDLKATIVHAVGTALGLGPTPLNNLEPFDTENGLGLPTETAALQLTGADGVPRLVGATPSMFPVAFLTEDSNGELVFGWRDLAPDDMSGVSFLYPLKDGQENFFTISQEARTRTRRGTGIPSAPISGAHIVAWADVANSGGVLRVPLFSTMSGLYVRYTNRNLVGKFHLVGLWKQLEIPSTTGQFFTTSYTLTMNPLDGSGLERQAPPGLGPSAFDSMQGTPPLSFTVDVRAETEFSTNYVSEVFNEKGNVYGIENYAAGTPIVWDFKKNQPVSAVSGKTIPTMLPLNRPMFGDPNDVCPLNVLDGIGTGGGGEGTTIDTETITNAVLGKINRNLRSFRDNVLLQTAVGTALVDTWYRLAPVMARFLARDAAAFALARGLVTRAPVLAGGIASLLLMVGSMLYMLKRRHARKAHAIRTGHTVAGLLILGLLLAGGAAEAQLLPRTTADMVAGATHVLHGKVIEAKGRRVPGAFLVYTDVTLELMGTAKGDVKADETQDNNQPPRVTFSVIGGQADGVGLVASGIPSFSKGEEVILYMREYPGRGLVIFGGVQGKQLVRVDPETQEKVVYADNPAGVAALKADWKTMQQKSADAVSEKSTTAPDASPGGIPVDAYMRYLRELAETR